MATLFVPGAGNVTYKEVPGSPREQMTGNTWRVIRIFDVAHSDRWAFLLGMFGNATVKTGIGLLNVSGQYISRIVPTAYQFTLGAAGNTAFLYPSSLESIEPLGVASQDLLGVATYPQCRITIGYEAPTYAILSDNDPDFVLSGYDESTLIRFVSVFVQPTAEYLTLPYGTYLWTEWNPNAGAVDYNNKVAQNTTYVGAPVIGSQAKLLAANEVQLVWHMVPGIPRAAYSLIGCVNNDTFSDPNGHFSAPIGTLLLSQMEVRPYRWILGNFLYDITYKFKLFNPTNPTTGSSVDELGDDIGHNHFLHYRPTTAGTFLPPVYRYLTHDGTPPRQSHKQGTGIPVYPYADFTQLFQPPLN